MASNYRGIEVNCVEETKICYIDTYCMLITIVLINYLQHKYSTYNLIISRSYARVIYIRSTG